MPNFVFSDNQEFYNLWKDIADAIAAPPFTGPFPNPVLEDDLFIWEQMQRVALGIALIGGTQIFIPGTGLESGRQKNTLFPNDASGNYSICIGSGNTSFGINSFSGGSGSGSFGLNSFSFGNQSFAISDSSFAEGDRTSSQSDGSHSEGLLTTANGQDSHAQNFSTVASGAHSSASGSQSVASGDASEASGQQCQALALGSHAEGISTIAGTGAVTGNAAHAEGNTTQAISPNSHAEGFLSIAQGENSHCEGAAGLSLGMNSHCEGNLCQSNGINSHAQNAQSIANGLNSSAENELTQANGISSHSEGRFSIAGGDYSHSQNELSLASGYASHAGGQSSFPTKEVLASGIASFNHSQNTAAQLPGQGATGNNSAILGGRNLHCPANRSVMLGGDARTELDANTTNVQELRVTENVKILAGNNKPLNIVTLDGSGTLTVLNTTVNTGAKIFLTYDTPAGVQTVLSAPTASIVNATSFVINSSVGDTSTVNYFIINP